MPIKEIAERTARPGVKGEVLEGKYTTMFELRVGEPEEFINRFLEHLSEIHRGVMSFTVDGVPLRLKSNDGIQRDSYVAVGDQVTRFFAAADGLRLFDTGMPYIEEDEMPRFGLPTLGSNRDGDITVHFGEGTGLGYVQATGGELETLIATTLGYLRGLKAGQETSE